MKSKVVDTGISARVVQKRDGILSLLYVVVLTANRTKRHTAF